MIAGLLAGVAASPIVAVAETTVAYDFEKLSGLVRRLDALEGTAERTLTGFYEPALTSFSVKPSPREEPRVCVTSTCYALLTILLSPGVYDSIVSYEEDDDERHRHQTNKTRENHSAATTTIPVRQVMRTLLRSAWREDDLFQVPLVLYTLLRVDKDRSLIRREALKNGAVADRIRKLLEAVLRACPEPRRGTRQVNSDYISYQVCKVLVLLTSEADGSSDQEGGDQHIGGAGGGLPATALPENVARNVYAALYKCAEVSSNELCRMLAHRAAGDTDSFDVIRLAYGLLTYLRSTECLSKTAGRELRPGRGPSPERQVSPPNKKLVASALEAYFQEQNQDGLWDKGQPIYKSFKRQGRNMENAFVFPVNTVGSLLCCLEAEDFRPHLAALERTLDWIESHQTTQVIADYCDPVSGQCYGKPIRGWSSPHFVDVSTAGPQAWPTAQVLKCVSWMKKRIRELMHNDVLAEFDGIAFSKNGKQANNWDRLLDSDLGNPSKQNSCRTLKSVLEERVVNPFAVQIDNPSPGAAYSAILFGPPGTAKVPSRETSLVCSIMCVHLFLTVHCTHLKFLRQRYAKLSRSEWVGTFWSLIRQLSWPMVFPMWRLASDTSLHVSRPCPNASFCLTKLKSLL
jgi:hypothetical protein